MLADPKLPEMRLIDLGQHMLIARGQSRALGNKSWDEKLATYAKSLPQNDEYIGSSQYPK